MVSDSGYTHLTDVQQLRDDAFLEVVKNDFVVPLCDEMENMHRGYSDLECEERFRWVVETNRQEQGRGDCLPIECGEHHLYVYAGCTLSIRLWHSIGRPCLEMFAMPLLSCDDVPMVYPGDEEVPRVGLRSHPSYLKMFLYRNPDAVEDSRGDIWDSTPLYKDLPIAFRVALVCRYISDHVIAPLADITAFVLGAERGIATMRYSASLTYDAVDRACGWNVRIRDLRPPHKLGRDVTAQLRNVIREAERVERSAYEAVTGVAPDERFLEESLFEQRESRPRSTNPKTDLMVEYIDNLLAKGTRIGRGGDLTWDQVAGNLAASYGDKVHAYNGNTLRDSYRSYKRRHGD